MKGCINHGMDPKCMNLECIDRSKAKKVNYCCCSGHMCNAKHELIPTTLTTTTTEAPPMRQDNCMYRIDQNRRINSFLRSILKLTFI